MERRNGVVASRKWMMFSLPVTSLSSLGAQSIDIDSGWEFASPRRPLSVDDLRSPLLITFRGCGGAQWICNWDVILVVSDKSSPIAFLFFAVAFHDPAQWWLDPAPRRCRPFFFFSWKKTDSTEGGTFGWRVDRASTHPHQFGWLIGSGWLLFFLFFLKSSVRVRSKEEKVLAFIPEWANTIEYTRIGHVVAVYRRRSIRQRMLPARGRW